MNHYRRLALACCCGLSISGCHAPEPAFGTDWPLSCDYISFESTTINPDHCGRRGSEGELIIRPDLLAELGAESGMQTIYVDETWLYALNGKTVSVLSYDNGADYFREGLARTMKDGKVGFVDESLDLVIAPMWDFAFPFENEYSLVCSGCTQEHDGEHSSITGGSWGYIDRTGKIIVEPIHSRDALPPRPE